MIVKTLLVILAISEYTGDIHPSETVLENVSVQQCHVIADDIKKDLADTAVSESYVKCYSLSDDDPSTTPDEGLGIVSPHYELPVEGRDGGAIFLPYVIPNNPNEYHLDTEIPTWKNNSAKGN